eukprot:Gregarina_sp_Poly_1__310@NODE_1076_length_5171_cov_48_773511_g747_i0_p2_GENE_NODE_1076_length_5171_cov_48_773511_g747_i0NODE_1076_length_5171_cov_48_773511_g747_i0_p2_ORF_typecomplete_len125_score16_93CKS/PF01111_19/3_7e31_NODE_1076_length_5171_cov_48_773511_g747_i046555029
MVHYPDEPVYSEKYADDAFEYRHVILTRQMAHEVKAILAKRPGEGLLMETEWRGIGVQQSRGWQHYLLHRPEPHVLLFRRPLGTDPTTGKPPREWQMPCDGRSSVPVTIDHLGGSRVTAVARGD